MTDGENSTKNARPTPLRRIRRYLLVALALWGLAGLCGGFAYRKGLARCWQATRLSVPVVVIESDDWGGGYRASYLTGEDRHRQYLDDAQAAAVKRLTGLLSRHSDSTGRHPIFSAFVVVGQADVSAILADPKHAYHWQPIDRTLPSLVAALNNARDAGAFTLQYHARDHKNSEIWTRALIQAAERARSDRTSLTAERIDAIWPEDKADRRAMMTEYHRRCDGHLVPLGVEETRAKVRQGLSAFNRIFGQASVSTVAPKYLWEPVTEDVWAEEGIRFVHGANHQVGPTRQADEAGLREFGARSPAGLVYVPRTADLGVERDGSVSTVTSVMQRIRRDIDRGQPAVISTHSWGYCLVDPATSRTMYASLDQLLTAIEREYPDLRYLSCEELGALADAGDGDTEIAVAGGFTRLWYVAGVLWADRPKIRLWLCGMAALTLLTATAFAVRRGRRDPTGSAEEAQS